MLLKLTNYCTKPIPLTISRKIKIDLPTLPSFIPLNNIPILLVLSYSAAKDKSVTVDSKHIKDATRKNNLTCVINDLET